MIRSRPLCVDLFAGAGGLSLGFEQAGFDVACAVEIDPVHCATHLRNFPDSAVICRGVEAVTGAEIRAAGKIGAADVAVVFGGSPCQGFSSIGKRMLDDPRNMLVAQFVRVVLELRPRHFVLENVKGLTAGAHKAFLDELVAAFDEGGYDVLTPMKVLNAAWFGVPQSRERLFVIGTRRGEAAPSYPQAAFRAAGRAGHLPSGPTVMDAIGDLPDAESFIELDGRDWVEARLGTPSAYAAVLRGAAADPFDLSHPRDWDASVMTSSARSKHTELTRSRFAATAPGQKEPVSRFLRLHPEGVCNTLRAGTGTDRGAFTAARPIHPVHPRCLTVREMARLHSYPDWFRFNHTKWSGARQVGNSVPPLLGRAVAAAVARAMGLVPERPRAPLGLGPDSLVTADRTSAERALSELSPSSRILLTEAAAA